MGRIADGVIVGSRLVRAVAEADGAGPAVEAVSEFIRAAREASTTAVARSSRFPAVQLVVFTVVALCAMLVAYAFGLGGAVGFLIFLAILFVGVVVRACRPR